MKVMFSYLHSSFITSMLKHANCVSIPLIRERVDKTPSALLRTALTSILRVNKTDVETLRASYGVRPPFLSLYL